MNKADIGAVVAGVVAVLSSVAMFAREYAGRALRYVGASFVSLLTSKAAWAAVVVTFLGAYTFGYLSGAAGKRALRAEVVELKTSAKSIAETAKSAGEAAREAEDKAKALAKTVATQTETIEALKKDTGPRVTAVPARPAPRAPKTAVPASEPVRAWAPWN